MKRLAILGGVRTPFCKAGSSLRGFLASDLGVVVAKELLARIPVPTKDIDEVIFGCGGPSSTEANISRVIALRAGIPKHVPAMTVQRNCASAFESITTAQNRMEAGRGGLFLVGGAESMSNYPLIMGPELTAFFERLMKARSMGQKLGTMLSFRPRFLKPRIAVVEGLTDSTCGMIMGITAEVVGREFGVTREEQDQLALRSHKLVTEAWASKAFAEEVCPVYADQRGKTVPVIEDNGHRGDQSMEALAKLKPYFDRRHGTVTVGNASQLTDGAVALLVGSEEKAKALGIEPLGYLTAYAYAGLDPQRMGLGPVFATPPALKQAGLTMKDIDLVELNEAFAAQVIGCERAFASKAFAQKELGLSEAVGEMDRNRLNVHGGAIALGHPVGATGSRLVLTLLLELKRRNLRRGLATLCIGGGQGGALIVERA